MTGEKRQISLPKNLIAGGFAGICLTFAGHPLDTIKVRLQTQLSTGESKLYKGTFDCFKKIVTKEGIRGLYKGMATPIIGITVVSGVNFFGYGCGLKLQDPSQPNNQYGAGQFFVGGMVSGVFKTLLVAPGERIKCLLQMQIDSAVGKRYAGPVDCAKQLYKQSGIRNVFKGTFATLVRDVPGSGFYFITYELMKQALTPEGGSSSNLGAGMVLLAGGTAGVANCVSTYAADTLKSRLQTAPEGRYRNLLHVFTSLYKQEGFMSLFQGFSAALLRSFPANAACFLGFEFALKILNWAAPSL
ncbi:mitochondrial carnitine/acylcarnitine carrier protein-like [Antedon mediterranea]|uniref:mitochondrial carnitine/acylcarnitine carrier protein-like n=1 Tax=Antedon mediterranea TaxID=105859 RepID=UPI003AF7AF3B